MFSLLIRMYRHRRLVWIRPSVTITSLIVSLAVVACIGYFVWLNWNPRDRSLWINQRSVDSYLDEYEEVERQQWRQNDHYTPQHEQNDAGVGTRSDVEQTPYVPTKFRRKRLTKKQRRLVCERSNYCCTRCGKFVPVWDREINHIHPLSSHLYRYYDLNDWQTNVELVCRSCHGRITFEQRRAGLFRH
jgi:5-methylcytosine-specific restriction endonuclease McrA